MKVLAIIVFSIWTALASALIAHAQSITTIHSFNGADGSYPIAGMTLGPDGNFYGITEYGGSSRYGSVFQLTAAGTLTTLVSFNGTNGANPNASLTLGPDGNFYGTTSGIDSAYSGTVFQVTTNGTLTTVVNFNGTNGANPYASLTLGPDGNFYGTTYYGGSNGYGTVFEVTTNGTLTTLVNFDGTNGLYPVAGLTLGPDNNFYSTTFNGGSSGDGTVFEVTTNGTLTTLANFNINNGYSPRGSLTLGPDGNFYGITSEEGGSGGYGTIFQLTTNGTLTTLVDFNGTNGAYPVASLTLGPDGNFYGTTSFGGISFVPDYGSPTGYGTVFQVTTNGTLTTLVNFNGTNGSNPDASLTLGPDGNLYGTSVNGSSDGGSSSAGSVFMVAPLSGPFFNGEVSLGTKWYYLATSGNVFGYYSMAYFPYVYHNNMGFEYYIDANDGANGAYFYDFTSEVWFYSQPDIFPYLYDFSLNAWLYYCPDASNPGNYTSNPRWFYNFSDSQWTTNMAAQ